MYRETLPCDAPPTYRGQLLKYAYKITIGVQRLGSPIKLLRVPIRVIVLQGWLPQLLKDIFMIYVDIKLDWTEAEEVISELQYNINDGLYRNILKLIYEMKTSLCNDPKQSIFRSE